MDTSARLKIHFFDPQTDNKAPRTRHNANKPLKDRYRLTNWPTYNQALIQQRRLQLWVDDQTCQNWHYTGPQKPGCIVILAPR